MIQSPKHAKFFVQVARLRIDIAVVEVSATDDEDAEHKAIDTARRLPDTAWRLQPFDRSSYQPHVETMIAEDELSASETVGDALQETETRYLLLRANRCSAEGNVVLQPWLTTDQPDLLASDLCRDWLGALNQLGLTHMSDRLDDLASGSPPMPSDQILFGARPQKNETSEPVCSGDRAWVGGSACPLNN